MKYETSNPITDRGNTILVAHYHIPDEIEKLYNQESGELVCRNCGRIITRSTSGLVDIQVSSHICYEEDFKF